MKNQQHIEIYKLIAEVMTALTTGGNKSVMINMERFQKSYSPDTTNAVSNRSYESNIEHFADLLTAQNLFDEYGITGLALNSETYDIKLTGLQDFTGLPGRPQKQKSYTGALLCSHTVLSSRRKSLVKTVNNKRKTI